jgi:hypothetical protein
MDRSPCQPPILLQPRHRAAQANECRLPRLADDDGPRQVVPPRLHGKLLLRPTFRCEVGEDGRREAGRTVRGAAGRRVPGMPWLGGKDGGDVSIFSRRLPGQIPYKTVSTVWLGTPKKR